MTHYYYDPKTNTLHGPIDRMPPVWDYGFPPDGPSDSQLASAEKDFDDTWNSFINDYLPTLPSHTHTFTGPSRVVPEGEIEWRYEMLSFKDEWIECSLHEYHHVAGEHRRRVATPKITGEPSIPAHIVDDMKLDSYYDGFKDGSKLTGEGKERPANKQIRHAATEYIQLPSHRQAIIWDKLGYNASFSVNTTAQEENKKFIQWLKDNNKVVEFIALFPLSGEPATQAPGYTSTRGEAKPEFDGNWDGNAVDDLIKENEKLIESLTDQPDKPNRYEYSNISEYLECYGDYVLRGTWNLPADFIAVNPPPSPTPEQGEKEADMGNPISETIPPDSGELQDHETIGFIAETYAMAEFNHHHECDKHMIAYNGFLSGVNYLMTGSLTPKASLPNEANPHMRQPPITAQPDKPEDEESLLDIAKSMYESAKKLLEQLEKG